MKEYGSVLHRPQTVEFHRTAIGKIIHIMREDPGVALDWNELSRIACISRFHFLRIFEELTNTSPHRFLIALRIERAKRLLFDTALSVADIGLRAGYRSAGTFVRVFKSLVGLTPGRLRQFRAELPTSELKYLLGSPLQNCLQLNPLSHFQIDLRASSEFTGIVCLGGLNSETLLSNKLRGTVVRQTYTTQLGLPSEVAGYKVCGIGFPESADASSYFLPDPESILVGSTKLNPGRLGSEGRQSVVLNLNKPSLFEPPILVCLPLLLLKLNNQLPHSILNDVQHNWIHYVPTDPTDQFSTENTTPAQPPV